ncbi:MAG TPA: TetR/AcrR family transcriptional regulator [Nitrososphaeraceae archaeon]|nr:TetR/AcrR family transcriptional regulator [Nitrososphaeraceae archaeon]
MCPKVTSQYKTNIRDRIVQSAIECFSEYGFDRSRMDDIAQRADLSKGTLYLYFKSKEDLFYAICENNLKVIKEQLSRIFATRKENLLYDVEQFYDNLQKLEKKGDEKVFFEIVAESARNPKLQNILYEQRTKIFDVVKEYLDLQVQKGFFRKNIDTEAIASGLVALYNGLAVSKFLGISGNWNKRAWVGTVKAIISGIS